MANVINVCLSPSSSSTNREGTQDHGSAVVIGAEHTRDPEALVKDCGEAEQQPDTTRRSFLCSADRRCRRSSKGRTTQEGLQMSVSRRRCQPCDAAIALRGKQRSTLRVWRPNGARDVVVLRCQCQCIMKQHIELLSIE